MTAPDLPWWAADFARPPGRGAVPDDPEGGAEEEPATAKPLPRGSVTVEPGAALVRLPGRRFRSLEARLTAPVLRPRQWEALFRLFAEQALYPAALLAGYLPRSARGELGSRGVRLVPPANRVEMTPADLPEETVHQARQLIAAHFAADPFHLLHFRGRDRAAVLSRVRRGWRATAPETVAGNGAVLGLDELEAILEEHGPAAGGQKQAAGGQKQAAGGQKQAAGDRTEDEAEAVPAGRQPLLPRVQQAEAFRGDPVLRANLSRLYTKVSERAAAVTPRSRPARAQSG